MMKRVNISVPEEEHRRMKQIALDLDMSVSDIIRKCFFKLSKDEKMRAIIKRGEFTSHNVRYENRPDEADGSEVSSSLEPTKNYKPFTEEEFKVLQRIMKTDWIGAEQ